MTVHVILIPVVTVPTKNYLSIDICEGFFFQD